ncbi:putative WD repeat-containing protein 61-like [Capsicum annuum]|nr:putative WD repeat-containing protein 61-like [Capsicum annuum]
MNLLKELEKKETEYIRQKHHKIYVADFEILTIIGRGAFGEVEHVRAKRNLLAEVASHFIVKLFYSFQDFDYLYLVMEYLPGGYMMMDMKPNNLVLDKNVHMMLSDFGLCKPRDHSNSLPINENEIMDGEKRGSANKWSLGAIMYEMLVGYPPFYFEDPITTYRKTVHWRNHITYLEEARLTSKAKDLICRLLCDAENRLSCQGSEQIKSTSSQKTFSEVGYKDELRPTFSRSKRLFATRIGPLGMGIPFPSGKVEVASMPASCRDTTFEDVSGLNTNRLESYRLNGLLLILNFEVPLANWVRVPLADG